MNDPSRIVNRIVIIGTSGSGKTVLGSKLANVLDMKFVDLDDLNWLPGWKQRPEEDFFYDIKRETSCENWVVSGNYARASKFIWPQADMIIWLDLPLYLCLWRALKRSLSLIFPRKASCNGNYETLSRLIGKHSILLWIWDTHSRRKKAYETHFSQVEESMCFLRLKNDKEVDEFVNQVLKNKFIKFNPTTSQRTPLSWKKNLTIKIIEELVRAIQPFDEIEACHQGDILRWIDSGGSLCRTRKADAPPKHLVS